MTTGNTTLGWEHSNVWVAGKLVANYDDYGPALHFVFEDPLGSKRVLANIAGEWDETCTSLPFGNDVGNPLPYLAPYQGLPQYANCMPNENNALDTFSDGTEHRFSQKELDPETGNDYFLARYYSPTFGRFLSPDWSAQEEPVPYASLDDPQTLNLYAYVRNNPLTSVDSDGHAFCPGWCDINGMAYQTQSETEAAERAYNAQAGYGKVTNAELSQRVAEQRAYLISFFPNEKAKLESNDDPTIFHEYMCLTHGDCGPTTYDPLPVLIQAAGTVDPGSTETHHMLPQNDTMKSFFEKRGLNVEDFTKDMTAAEHRLKPNGLHTKGGGDWNGVWEDWIGKNPNATRAQILRQLQKMKKDFKIK